MARTCIQINSFWIFIFIFLTNFQSGIYFQHLKAICVNIRGSFNNYAFFILTAPSVPRDLHLVAQNASVILVTWSTPSLLNGLLGNLKYLIKYESKTGNHSDELSVSHVPDEDPQQTALNKLQADTQYVVSVRAGRQRSDGVELWSVRFASKLVKTLHLGELAELIW